MPTESADASAKRIDRIIELLRQPTPRGLQQAHDQFCQLRSLVQEHVCEHVAGPLNRHLEGLPRSNVNERQALCKQANQIMQSLGISAQCPRSGQPGILGLRHATPPRPDRFYIELLAEGARQRHFSSAELPTLTLVPRPEAASSYWRDRTAQVLGRKSGRS